MLIISVRGNKNNRWKRNVKTKKQKRTWGKEVIAKGWEINDFGQFHRCCMGQTEVSFLLKYMYQI